MDAPDHSNANADQIAFWNSDPGLRWVANQDRIDAMMAPLTERLLEGAAPALGETVLDVGCGFGTTAILLSQRVGVGGSVLGVDVSRPMLDLAGRRIAADGIGNIELMEADATTGAFGAGTIDLAFSRFGVMFFADPVAAFRNIRTALRPGGRLAFVCWRKLQDNPCFLLPLAAARPHLPALPASDPNEPGMFAYADPERLRSILADAGFSDIALVAHDPVTMAGAPDRVLEMALQLGPVSRALREATQAQKDAAEHAVRAALAAEAGSDGDVRLTGGVWLVSAR